MMQRMPDRYFLMRLPVTLYVSETDAQLSSASTLSRSVDLHPRNTLHDARMTRLVKLRCGIGSSHGGRLGPLDETV